MAGILIVDSARKKRQARVWIVDDEPGQRQRAKEVVQHVFQSAGIPLQVTEWDGVALLPSGPKADFVILDLNLGDHVPSGLKLFGNIPGVQPDRISGPFIIIWSHFEGDPTHKLSTVLSQYPGDRMVRTRWKSETHLQEALECLVQRFKDEGVSHGE